MANVWADKQYYKLISRNRVPFVRYGGAGRGLISSKWCNRPWPVTLQYQFDPANGPSVPRNCKQTYSKGEKRPDRFVVTRTRYSNGLVNLLVTLHPSYYLNNASLFFASLQRYILIIQHFEKQFEENH